MKNTMMKKVVGAVTAMSAVASISNAQIKGIEWDGFGSAYVAQADGSSIPDGFANRRMDYSQFSSLGLNLHAKMDDQFSATAQLLARGSDEYEMSVEWAFLTYAPSQDFNIKVGRLLFPLWIAAEYYNVGYLLPYRSMPGDVYGLSPFSAFDGVMANKLFDTGMGKLTLSAFTGTAPTVSVPSTLDVEIYDYFGLTATLQGDGWTAKVGYTDAKTKTTLGTAFSVLGLNGKVYNSRPKTTSLGLKYDKHNVVFWSEMISIFAGDKDADVTFLGERSIESAGGGYGLIGYRMGKWMPRYTYATAYSRYGLPNTTGVVDASTKNQSESHVLGVNYEVGDQSVLKVEYQTVKITSGAGVGAQKTGSDDDGSAVYAGLDFTF